LNERELSIGTAFPDADVVIATWWETAEWVARLLPSKGAKVYFIQGHEVYDYLPIERVIATYKQPFHRIVISKWLMRTLQESYEITAPDFVPNSYDKDQFFAPVRHKSSIPTVGFLYSALELKGADAVIAAIRILKTRFKKIRVISFGTSSPKTDEVPTEDFEFHLLPKQNEIRTLYAQCDVWISGSRSEGFNLTALEAMACLTPLVSTKTGWPCDSIIDGKNGYLVEVDDIPSLASAAQKVLELPDVEWQHMSLNAFETANFGSWDVSAKAFESSLIRSIQLQST
jgi:glycosyltransferase involved in cell wall biosynthesis